MIPEVILTSRDNTRLVLWGVTGTDELTCEACMPTRDVRAGRIFFHNGDKYKLLLGAKAMIYAVDINLDGPVTLLQRA